jgi:hypothetical protein
MDYAAFLGVIVGLTVVLTGQFLPGPVCRFLHSGVSFAPTENLDAEMKNCHAKPPLKKVRMTIMTI